jgi:hypothetical protein
MPPAPTNGNRDADLMLELANYLANGLNMTLGVNVFIGELPEPGINGVPATNVDAIYLVEMPGPEPDEYVDTETYLVDIWSSSSDSTNARALLRRVFDILQRQGNYTLTNWYVYFSSASGTIRDESRGREGTRLCSQSWRLITRNLNNIS